MSSFAEGATRKLRGQQRAPQIPFPSTKSHMAMFERDLGNRWIARVTSIDSATLLLDVWAPTDHLKPIRAQVQVPRTGLASATRVATCDKAVATVRVVVGAEANALWLIVKPEPSNMAERIALLLRDVDREP